MSVQRNEYLMYGVIIPFDADFERYEEYMDSAFNKRTNPKNKITVLFDGMDGDYIAIGHVILKSDNWAQFKKTTRLMEIDEFDRVMIESYIEDKFDIGDAEFGWYYVGHER